MIHIRVDKKTAGPLTSGQDQLYEILVLHLVGGKDIFITVSGEYQRSSFGASIDALVRMTVPICDLSTSSILQLEGNIIQGPPYVFVTFKIDLCPHWTELLPFSNIESIFLF